MTASASPRVTVLMPVRNGGPFLAEAVHSILGQSFADFEFLIVDDGSTDDTVSVIREFTDDRIRLVRNDGGAGLVSALNRGLELAHGEFIARMDADDISLPDRLERQLRFLERHPQVDLCGCWIEAFEGTRRTVWPAPLDDGEIRASLLFESVLYHPAVMMRQTALSRGPFRYDADYPHAEDFELWCRMATSCRFATIGEVLLRYRLHDQGTGTRNAALQEASANRVRRTMLTRLGIEPTDEEMALHTALSCWRIEPRRHFLEQAHDWLLMLQHANRERNLLPHQALTAVLARRWHEICLLAAPLGLDVCRFYYGSPLRASLSLPLRHHLAFLLRAMLRRGGEG